MAVTPDLNQIAVVMSQLQHNYSQLAQNWFDVFYNPTAEDITVTFFDELGNLETYSVPNRAKAFVGLKEGEGSPEGEITADKGVIYRDTENGNGYIKTTATGNTGWKQLVTQSDLDDFIKKGEVDPEGQITASIGTLYVNKTNGSLYVKQSDGGNTNWLELTMQTYTAGEGISISNNVITNTETLPSQTGQSGKFLMTDGTTTSWSDASYIQVSVMPTASATLLGKIYQYVGATSNDYKNAYFYKCVAISSSDVYTVSQTTGGNSLGTVTVNGTVFSSQISSIGTYTFTSKGYPTKLYIMAGVQDNSVGITGVRVDLVRNTTLDNGAAGTYGWETSDSTLQLWTTTKTPTTTDTLYSDNLHATASTIGTIQSTEGESTSDLYWSYNSTNVSLSTYGIYYTGNEAKGDVITVEHTIGSTYDWENVQVSTGWTPSILQTFWSDHLLNRTDMLRADDFSWNSGLVYSTVYNELLTDFNNSKVSLYGFSYLDETVYTQNATVSLGDSVYGGSPLHLIGTITAISGNTITCNSTVYTRDTSTDTNDVVYISVDNIYFVRTSKGYKICPASQESVVLSKYNTDGIAWFYILDTTNTQFKLPRTKWSFKGLRGVAGDDVDESLPNITGTVREAEDVGLTWGATTGVFSGDGSGSKSIDTTSSYYSGFQGIKFDASSSSSVYQNNAPVQERATQMYLYFYVGEFSQSATEQTAGLNSELFNGKVDKSGSSYIVKTTYVNGTSGYRIWTDGYCEQWGTVQQTANILTITLLKTYQDTNYGTIAIDLWNSTANGYPAVWVDNTGTKTVSSFRICDWHTTSLDNEVYWKASGYLADGQY